MYTLVDLVKDINQVPVLMIRTQSYIHIGSNFQREISKDSLNPTMTGKNKEDIKINWDGYKRGSELIPIMRGDRRSKRHRILDASLADILVYRILDSDV